MIIKSMSRKHASFSQLIDYLERGTDRKNTFSVRFNMYSRDTEALKAEFSQNAERLKFRKNGVYLYHEVISIKRTHRISEDQQKEALQKIVMEYLRRRASKQLAYAVLHEDQKDHLHFHCVISANEAQTDTRKRLSKAEFAEIQASLEKWVLETFPQLEQQAVFAPNQTDQQKQAKAQKARISNDGAELKRRGGKTTKRDNIKATLEDIFSTATSGQHFTELLQQAGFTFYTRGKHHGVTTEDGTKYRFASLGLAEAWDDLDKRMMEALHQGAKKVQDTLQHTPKTILGQPHTPREDTTKAKQEAKTGEKQKTEDRKQDRKQDSHHTEQDTSQDTPKTAEKQPQDTKHTTQDPLNNTQDDTPKDTQDNTPKDTHKPSSTAPPLDPIAEEAERRREEMRAKRAKQDTHQTSTKTSHRQKPT